MIYLPSITFGQDKDTIQTATDIIVSDSSSIATTQVKIYVQENTKIHTGKNLSFTNAEIVYIKKSTSNKIEKVKTKLPSIAKSNKDEVSIYKEIQKRVPKKSTEKRKLFAYPFTPYHSTFSTLIFVKTIVPSKRIDSQYKTANLVRSEYINKTILSTEKLVSYNYPTLDSEIHSILSLFHAMRPPPRID